MYLASPSVPAQLLGSGLIGVREGLETGIVVMILIAFLVKSDRRDALAWVWAGVTAAVTMVVGIFLIIHFGTSTVTTLTAELIAGVASLVAVGIVTFMVLWMSKAAAHISTDLKHGMSNALVNGGFSVLGLAFLAVGREGFETALLMVGYAESFSGSLWPLLGLLLGVLVAVGITIGLYRGAVRLNFQKFFLYTGVFLIFVAAGILGYGIRALQTVGWLPGGSALAFDLTPHYDQSSWYGTLLAGIFNVRADPTVLQLSGWFLYVVVVLTLFIRANRVRTPSAQAPGEGKPQTPAEHEAGM